LESGVIIERLLAAIQSLPANLREELLALLAKR